ncbi:MAG: CRTAC1 family protein [Chthonomonadales bacterium]
MKRLLLIALLDTLMVGCGKTSEPKSTVAEAPPDVKFRDVTQAAGIDFLHVNGATGKKYMPETMGSGCAVFDFDNDDKQDILLINSEPWANSSSATMHVYRNLDGTHFRDATVEVGLDVPIYGMGVAVGDYDNDGFEDLFITGVGGCKIFHNVPGPDGHSRRFVDVTKSAGLESPGWATSATWVDYDRDGKLDLFVCHYVKWSQKTDQFFSIDGVRKSYATPMQYEGESCRLYHNDGRGKFSDVTKAAGIYNPQSKALGVCICDFDQDGWPDLIVANDTTPNFLFHNETNGTFKEVAIQSGIGIGQSGKAKAGMGVDIADELQTGHESIILTNFAGEQMTLYRWSEGGLYLDAAAPSGIGNASQLYLGFGVMFVDYDGDGWPDILVANGHIQDDALSRESGVRYEEPTLLFRNLGGGKYSDVSASVGAALSNPSVGRGAAWGDFSNTGHPDLLTTSNAGHARLLHNENKTGNHWLRIKLVGTRSNRDAIGARVRVRFGEHNLTQMVKGGNSYLSQSDRRLLFGLGKATQAESIEIQWPLGSVQSIGITKSDQAITLTEPKE